jgi:hypothetical protein
MPRYSFNLWEETKSVITFEADSLEHAKELLQEAEQEMGVDELPEIKRYFQKGDETWDTETLAEIKEDN